MLQRSWASHAAPHYEVHWHPLGWGRLRSREPLALGSACRSPGFGSARLWGRGSLLRHWIVCRGCRRSVAEAITSESISLLCSASPASVPRPHSDSPFRGDVTRAGTGLQTVSNRPTKLIAQASGDPALDIRLCRSGEWGLADHPNSLQKLISPFLVAMEGLHKAVFGRIVR